MKHPHLNTYGRCSKQALAPRTREERKSVGEPVVAYLRDRDFDYDPPAIADEPVVDRREGPGILGWRWCRHEIENYLLEPELVAAALGWQPVAYSIGLLAAAKRIRQYQVARWVVGTARRSVPPAYDLRTRPGEIDRYEIRVPGDLSEQHCLRWARTRIREFSNHVSTSLDVEVIEASIETRLRQLSEAAFGSTAYVLLWCSGKDLMASLEPFLTARGVDSPGLFRGRIRDWISENPEATLACLPEWQRLLKLLRVS